MQAEMKFPPVLDGTVPPLAAEGPTGPFTDFPVRDVNIPIKFTM